mmetsp:Transcript_72599/g.127979  ORF Transcript_72599/g.127979 Transcript_72599/m.127979 type:complete len:282 (+) Transcript_72599:274-1119(+)
MLSACSPERLLFLLVILRIVSPGKLRLSCGQPMGRAIHTHTAVPAHRYVQISARGSQSQVFSRCPFVFCKDMACTLLILWVFPQDERAGRMVRGLGGSPIRASIIIYLRVRVVPSSSLNTSSLCWARYSCSWIESSTACFMKCTSTASCSWVGIFSLLIASVAVLIARTTGFAAAHTSLCARMRVPVCACVCKCSNDLTPAQVHLKRRTKPVAVHMSRLASVTKRLVWADVSQSILDINKNARHWQGIMDRNVHPASSHNHHPKIRNVSQFTTLATRHYLR